MARMVDTVGPGRYRCYLHPLPITSFSSEGFPELNLTIETGEPAFNRKVHPYGGKAIQFRVDACDRWDCSADLSPDGKRDRRQADREANETSVDHLHERWQRKPHLRAVQPPAILDG